MDIPQDLFPQYLLRIIEEIAESHFVALDLEFSGIAHLRGRKGKPNLQEHYEEVKAAAEKYQILQVGIAIVREDVNDGRYIVKPYNFNLSPLPKLHERIFSRTWSFNSGAIQFLLKNHFKFDLPLTQGIPYLSRKEEHQARSSMIQEEEIRANVSELGIKKEDDALVEHIRYSINKWKALKSESRENYLNLPVDGAKGSIPRTFNRYQTWLTHQVVRSEYPELHSQSMGHFVQITILAAGLRENQREYKISHAVGFRWLLEAIMTGNIAGIPSEYFPADRFGNIEDEGSEKVRKSFLEDLRIRLNRRRKVLIGHNCFIDLVYLYDCFIGDLPESVHVFREEIHDLFPAIVDTKFIAPFGLGRFNKTSLEELETELQAEPIPRINVPVDFTRYQHADIYHEAGYDSFVTAKVAIRLSAKMERERTYLERSPKPLNTLQDSQGDFKFGVQEDGYVTASESISESEDDADNTRKTSQGFISSVRAVKKLFRKMSLKHGSDESKVESESQICGIPEASAFQQKRTTDHMGGDLAVDQGEDTKNLENPASGSKTSGDKDKIEMMIEQGEVMPPWYGNGPFWQLFGNTLQVNSCREGLMRLSGRDQ